MASLDAGEQSGLVSDVFLRPFALGDVDVGGYRAAHVTLVVKERLSIR